MKSLLQLSSKISSWAPYSPARKKMEVNFSPLPVYFKKPERLRFKLAQFRTSREQTQPPDSEVALHCSGRESHSARPGILSTAIYQKDCGKLNCQISRFPQYVHGEIDIPIINIRPSDDIEIILIKSFQTITSLSSRRSEERVFNPSRQNNKKLSSIFISRASFLLGLFYLYLNKSNVSVT